MNILKNKTSQYIFKRLKRKLDKKMLKCFSGNYKYIYFFLGGGVENCIFLTFYLSKRTKVSLTHN